MTSYQLLSNSFLPSAGYPTLSHDMETRQRRLLAACEAYAGHEGVDQLVKILKGPLPLDVKLPGLLGKLAKDVLREQPYGAIIEAEGTYARFSQHAAKLQQTVPKIENRLPRWFHFKVVRITRMSPEFIKRFKGKVLRFGKLGLTAKEIKASFDVWMILRWA